MAATAAATAKVVAPSAYSEDFGSMTSFVSGYVGGAGDFVTDSMFGCLDRKYAKFMTHGVMSLTTIALIPALNFPISFAYGRIFGSNNKDTDTTNVENSASEENGATKKAEEKKSKEKQDDKGYDFKEYLTPKALAVTGGALLLSSLAYVGYNKWSNENNEEKAPRLKY